MLQAFDAPTREESCARRSVSNTPLQALVLLNDPTFNEAAVHMAEKALAMKTTDNQRVQAMFEKTTGRLPSAKELKTLDDYLLSQKKTLYFQLPFSAFGGIKPACDAAFGRAKQAG